MKMDKKVKCLHCGHEITNNGQCSCGKVKMTQESVIVGTFGTDYIDVSPKILNENV